jgi:hypothetical protein
MPQIYVTVPGVEDFQSVVELLCVAGAEITTARREFVVDEPLTRNQAAALWELAQYREFDGIRLDVRADPDADLAVALAAMCPQGFDPDAPDAAVELGDPEINPDGWWADQQRRQSSRAARPSRAAVQAARANPVCCGHGGAWAPSAGSPPVPGCKLCPNSTTTYWRTHRANGLPYEPVQPLM